MARLLDENCLKRRTPRASARDDGITVYLASAHRSIARQTEIIRTKLDAGVGIAEILTLCAAPGYSEHHAGRAVDIGTPGSRELEEEFENTAAFQWLTVHAARFRFTLSYPRGNAAGYIYEPWHWCYTDMRVEMKGAASG